MHVKYDSMLFHHDKRFMDDNLILLTFTNDLARKVYAIYVNGATETDTVMLLQRFVW